MNIQELNSSEANVFETFANDTIRRNEDVFSLLSIISSLDYNQTIAIDSEWGGGKSFFVKQCTMILDAHCDNNHSLYQSYFERVKEKCNDKILPDSTLAVYYDAWANDNENDPLLSILLNIIESQGIDIKGGSGWLEIIDQFVSAISSILPWSVNFKIKDTVEACKGTDIFESIKTPRKILELWESILKKLFEGTGTQRIVIFIDELDRCRPTFAVRLLERVKHYFIQDSVTCVYAINSTQLQHTIKHEYGNDFNGCKYLDRFFNLTFTLPAITTENYFKFHKVQTNRWDYYLIIELGKKFNFSLRDSARIIKKVVELQDVYTFNDNSGTYDVINRLNRRFIIPLLVSLKHYDSNFYNALLKGEKEDFFVNLVSLHDVAYSLCGITQNRIDILTPDLAKEFYRLLFVEEISYSTTKTIGGLHLESSIKTFIGYIRKLL